MREKQQHQRRRSDPAQEVCVYRPVPCVAAHSFIHSYQDTVSFTTRYSVSGEDRHSWVPDPPIYVNQVRETKAARSFLPNKKRAVSKVS